MKLLVIILGLTAFAEALASKFWIWDLLERKGAESGSQLIYELFSCRLCLSFWTGTLITIVASLIAGPELIHLMIPFVVSGILTHLRR